jgi:hypothetical protein
MSESSMIHPLLSRWRFPALLVGLCAIALAFVTTFFSDALRPRFFLAYLHAYMFWLGIPLGCFALLMLQHLTGGKWGLAIRRLLESGSRMFPLMAILFIPLAFGIRYIYIWDQPHYFDGDHSPVRPVWLESRFFIVRAAFYFVIWIVFSFWLNRWSGQEDRGLIRGPSRRFQNLSAAGIVIYGLTVTLAAIDWVMSLSPHWFSTIYGLLFLVGQVLSALAAMIALLVLLSVEGGPLAELVSPTVFQDLGNLLLAFVMLWAYISFSQLLIIWSGNLAEEVPFYTYRIPGGWRYVCAMLILFHFCLPFVILLSRFVKRRGRYLALVALFIILMRLVDLLWLIYPGYAQGHGEVHRAIPSFWYGIWAFAILPIGIGGVWFFVFTWQLGRRPLVPLNDPRLAELEGQAHE